MTEEANNEELSLDDIAEAQQNVRAVPETEAGTVMQELAAESMIAELKAENAKLKDQALRAMAEAENIRKRTEREVEDSAKYANTAIARDLIGVLENLHRAEANLPDGEQREGVTLTRKELEKAFEKHGIKRMEPAGQKFDHNFHQAVAQVEDPNVESGTVVQVLQAGYVIRDRLLRAAMVTVSK